MQTRTLLIGAGLALASVGTAAWQMPAPPTNLRLTSDAPTPTPTPNPDPTSGNCGEITATGKYRYFEQLAARKDCLGAYTMRSQAQLDQLVKLGPSRYFLYDSKRDAAQYYKPAGDKEPGMTESIPGNQQLRFPVGVTSGSILVTWDFWWGPEFKTNLGSIDVYKTFRMMSGENLDGNTSYLGLKDLFTFATAPDDVSMHQESFYGEILAPGVQTKEPFHPTGEGAVPHRTFATKHSRWTRYWLEVKMNVPGDQFVEWRRTYLNNASMPGNWDMVTIWIADEQRDPTRVVYRVPVRRKASDTMIANFRYLFNTSTNAPAQKGPLYGWSRNLVILRNPVVDEKDTAIFQRPVQ